LADRRDYVHQITAATWVPMECHAGRGGDYRGIGIATEADVE
jgi:hypothetical protein